MQKNLMYVKERYNKKGELRFELHCSGKDPKTKKNQVYIKTYAVPLELKGKKEIDQFKLKCQMEWAEEVKNKSKGFIIKNNITFCEYAEKWVNDILNRNRESYNHYSNCKHNLKIFKEKFGNYTLTDMNYSIIKDFYLWLNTRTYKKEIIIVKKDIKDLIKEKGLTLTKFANECKISDCTLKIARSIGSRISKETAIKISNYLNISINSLFDIKSEEVLYSKSANKSLKTMLQSILGEALKESLIEINYATRDYSMKITGTEKTKDIYSDMEEIKSFIKALDKEEDIRHKTAFSIAINLGLRGCEISGLEWKDIDFKNQIINIKRNCLYVANFGTKTKATKNKSSERTIPLTNHLIELLKEYKLWWDEEKLKLGDLWEKTDRLFCQWNGKNMSNQTIAGWLNKFEEKNNLKKVTLHGLRHTNITMLIVNGVDVKTVSARVGHNNPQTTLCIYSHYTKEASKEASKKIDDLLYA